MKRVLLAIIVLLSVSACNSPSIQHDKEVQHKANKLQNITSGPLAPKPDSTAQSTETTSTMK